jgi:hypothetical protein
MQITYGGVPIANEPPGGTDGTSGFLVPKATQNVEWIEGLRSPDAYPRALYNRKRTVTGGVFPAALTTYAAALLARTRFYEQLPAYGALVIIQDAQVVTFAQAVLQDIDVVEEMTFGVSFGLNFTFQCGPPVFTTLNNALGTGVAGQILGTGNGGELGTGL